MYKIEISLLDRDVCVRELCLKYTTMCPSVLEIICMTMYRKMTALRKSQHCLNDSASQYLHCNTSVFKATCFSSWRRSLVVCLTIFSSSSSRAFFKNSYMRNKQLKSQKPIPKLNKNFPDFLYRTSDITIKIFIMMSLCVI